MSRFIEVHEIEHTGLKKVIINTDWIVKVYQDNNGTRINLGFVSGNNANILQSILVKETYNTLLDLL